MAYAILRTAKLKGAGQVARSTAHAYRERETPNADPEKTPLNEIVVQYDAEKTRNDIEAARTRKDNVEVVEVMITKSPDWDQTASREQKDEFNRRAVEFLKEKFGEENVRSAVVHRDETTEHVSAHVTPIHDGRLDCKEFLGGREKMRELQTEFAEKVKDLGLERGLEGSKAKHVAVARYYAQVNEPPKEQERLLPKIHLPEPVREWGGIKQERLEDYGRRCADAVVEAIGPKMKALKEQVESLKKDRDAYKQHTRWSRGKAKTFEAMKVKAKTLEASYSTISRDNEKLKGRCQQQEKALTIVSRSKTIEPAIKVEIQKTLGQDRDRGRGR